MAPKTALRDLATDRGLVGGPFGSSLGQKDYVTDGVPVIRGTNLNFGKYLGGDFVYVSQDKASKELARNTAEPGDLVFTQRGTLGQVALVPHNLHSDYVISQSQMRLRVDTRLANPMFIYYACTDVSFSRQVDDRAIRTGVPHINLGILADLQVPLPSIAVQNAIAEVLGALDDKITANTRLATASQELAAAQFQSALATGSTSASINELSSLLSRGITPKYADDDESMTVVNQKCIRGGRVNLAPARRTELSRTRADKVLIANDVLVNSTGQGTLGRVARWAFEFEATVDSHVTIIRFDPRKVDPVCAGHAVHRAESTIEAMGEGSTGQTELSRAMLGQLQVRVPSIDRQRSLGPILRQLSRLENQVLQENDHLGTTRDALLPQLMSGKLRVKDAEKVVEGAV